MDKQALIETRFWETKSLDAMSTEEWELLCDGCAQCCLIKLIDEDTDELVYTNVACNLLDLHECRCADYEHRHQFEPDCIKLTRELIPTLKWLPATCAYKRLANKKPLPAWHPLLTGSVDAMHRKGKSAQDKAIHERDRGDWEQHIVTWKL